MKTKETIAKEIYREDFDKLCEDKKRIVLTMLVVSEKEKDRFSNIPRVSFILFKLTSLILLWLAFFMRIRIFVVISFLILAISVLFKIKNNPLIIFYSSTISKLIRWKDEILDEKAVNFANKGGSILQIICIFFLYNSRIAGWIILLIVAIIKTISTLGFCPGVKIYYCLNNGCCMLTRKK